MPRFLDSSSSKSGVFFGETEDITVLTTAPECQTRSAMRSHMSSNRVHVRSGTLLVIKIVITSP